MNVMADYCLGLYEKALPASLTFAQMLNETARGGFDALELSIDESDFRLSRLNWDREERKSIVALSRDSGIPIRSLCLSAHRRFPLGSHDSQIRTRSMEILIAALHLCGDLGIRLIQLAGYDVYYEGSDTDTQQWFAENLHRGAEAAAKDGILLGFETMETPFMDTVAKAMYWVRKIHSPYLGVYPDIGNLKNAALVYGSDLIADLESGLGHIFASHLKETRPGVYRNLHFGDGHTEYQPCIEHLYAMGVRHFTGEFWYQNEPNFQRLLSDSSTFLRSKLDTAGNSSAQDFALLQSP